MRLQALPLTVTHELCNQHHQEGNHEHEGCQRVDLHRDTALGRTPDEDRERDQGSCIEVADDEVIERERKSEKSCAQDAGQYQRKSHISKGRTWTGVEIPRSLLEARIQPLKTRLYGDHHERDDEHDVGEDHCRST